MDRVTKTLLALIAAALWGLLLRPLLAPGPAGAAPARPPVSLAPAAVAASNGFVYVAQGGRLYVYTGVSRMGFVPVRTIGTNP